MNNNISKITIIVTIVLLITSVNSCVNGNQAISDDLSNIESHESEITTNDNLKELRDQTLLPYPGNIEMPRDTNKRSEQQNLMRIKGDDPPWGITQVVTPDLDLSSSFGSIAVEPDGTAHVAWYGDNTIFYKMKNSSGTWTPCEIVSSENSNDHKYIGTRALGVDGFGTVHVVWADKTDYGYGNNGKSHQACYKYKPVGGSWSLVEVISVGDEDTEGPVFPSLDVEADGTVHAVWRSDYNYSNCGDDNDIFYRQKPSGSSWGDLEIVSLDGSHGTYDPTVAVDSSGVAHVAWAEYDGDHYYDILYRKRSINGGFMVNPTEQIALAFSDFWYILVFLSVGPGGVVHATWEDNGGFDGSGSDYDIYYSKRSINNGWGVSELISIENDQENVVTAIDVDQWGTVHIAWYDADNDNPIPDEIYYNQKPIDDEWTMTELVSTEGDGEYKLYPSMDIDEYGKVHVIWCDTSDYQNPPGYGNVFYKIRGGNWTFMVYMDGDNDLEYYLIEDFLEMAYVGSDKNISIVALLDRIPYPDPLDDDTRFGDWTDTRRGFIETGDEPWNESAADPEDVWGESVGELNMGDPRTLIDFVNWATANYPARNYAIILEDHGKGWLPRFNEFGTRGACWDETDTDFLNMSEIGDAFDSIYSSIDLIGFDCCLMAMIECAYEIKDEAPVYVASEKTEPGFGWPYNTILANLVDHSESTAEELGADIVHCFGNFYGTDNVTLSAINLSLTTQISNAISNLASTIMNVANDSDYQLLKDHRNNSPYFTYDEYTDPEDEDYRDLGEFLTYVANDNLLNASIVLASQTALDIYNNIIINNYAYPTGSGSGLSIYFQKNGTEPNSDYNSTTLDFAADTEWDEFLNWWVNGPPIPGDANGDGRVNIDDIFEVLNHWDEQGGLADVNEDGVVNIDDIFFILGHWT